MAIGPANGMKAKGEQVSAAPKGPCCGLRYAGWTGAGIGDAGPAAAIAGPNAIIGTVAAATIAARSRFLVMVFLLVARRSAPRGSGVPSDCALLIVSAGTPHVTAMGYPFCRHQ
ncbi:hypothetical protein ACGFIU_24835 [Rhodococcus oryzae]|uniref:hypothetical protein n=1 Tax=Rhodococcus oryzae TaxID=2571143 RepID=UPI00371D9387